MTFRFFASFVHVKKIFIDSLSSIIKQRNSPFLPKNIILFKLFHHFIAQQKFLHQIWFFCLNIFLAFIAAVLTISAMVSLAAVWNLKLNLYSPDGISGGNTNFAPSLMSPYFMPKGPVNGHSAKKLGYRSLKERINNLIGRSESHSSERAQHKSKSKSSTKDSVVALYTNKSCVWTQMSSCTPFATPWMLAKWCPLAFGNMRQVKFSI